MPATAAARPRAGLAAAPAALLLTAAAVGRAVAAAAAAQPSYLIRTFAGGQSGAVPATAAAMAPYGLALDGAGGLHIADTGDVVRRVSPAGDVRIVAGIGGGAAGGFAGDGG